MHEQHPYDRDMADVTTMLSQAAKLEAVSPLAFATQSPHHLHHQQQQQQPIPAPLIRQANQLPALQATMSLPTDLTAASLARSIHFGEGLQSINELTMFDVDGMVDAAVQQTNHSNHNPPSSSHSHGRSNSREGLPKMSSSSEYVLQELRSKMKNSSERLTLATPSFEKIYSDIKGSISKMVGRRPPDKE